MQWEVNGDVIMTTTFTAKVEAFTEEAAIEEVKELVGQCLVVSSRNSYLTIDTNCIDSYEVEDFGITEQVDVAGLQEENRKLKQLVKDYDKRLTMLKTVLNGES